jgi:hypothetical protein
MNCMRCRLHGVLSLAAAGHICKSVDDHCVFCGRVLWVLISVVDARGSLSETIQCPCSSGRPA